MLIVSTLFAGNQININQTAKSSYPELSLQEKNQIPEFSNSIRARSIEFNSSLQSLNSNNIGDVILLQIFDDKSYLSNITNVTTDINGVKVIVTRLTQFNYAYCIITISDNATTINVEIPELKEYYISRLHPQTRNPFVLLLDNNNLNILEGSSSVIEQAGNIINNSNSPKGNLIPVPEIDNSPVNTTRLGTNDPAQIDVMIVYTPAAASWATTNEGGINNTIAAAMTKANLASTNSGLGITFNLVHSYQVSYTEVNANSDLTALKTNGDGIIDDVHTNRTLYNADMVPMFTLENVTGGLGYVLNSKYGREDLAFCINRVQQVSTSYTMIHEMGHNMGASHHKDQLTQAGPTTWTNWPENGWSAGWRWTDGSAYYCDLMTYSGSGDFADGNPSTRIAQFSSPNYTDHGQTTGDAVYGDNARTLKEVKHYVAQYKDAATQLYCTAQGSSSNYTTYNIINVSMGDINQPSSYSIYSDFSFNTTDVTIGQSTNISVTLDNGDYNLNRVLIWVDWNNDKDFDDASESVYVSALSNSTLFTTGITPPSGISAGEKRMRIRYVLNGYGDETACGNAQYGEVEDYTLNVIAAQTYTVNFSVTGSNGTLGATVDAVPITSGASVMEGKNVVFTAAPASGYQLKKWYVDGSPIVYTDLVYTLPNLNASKTVTVEFEAIPTYTVSFTVNDGTNIIVGANVNFNSQNIITNSSGVAEFTGVFAGNNLPYTVSKAGYQNTNGTLNVVNSNVNETVSIYIATFNILFTVTDGTTPVEGATVICDGVSQYTALDGKTTFDNKANGTYNFTVNKSGYYESTGTVTVSGGNTNKSVLLSIITYNVEFAVKEGTTPITNATVTFNGSSLNTNSSGIATFANVAPGVGKAYSVQKYGYFTQSGSLDVDGNESQEILLSVAYYDVTFNVSDGTNNIENAKVTFNGLDQYTNTSGSTTFVNVSVGNALPYTVVKAGFDTLISSVNVIDQNVTENVVLGSSIPATKLYYSFCGFSTGNLTSSIYCDAVSGAQDYEYIFENDTIGYSQTIQRGSSLTYITLANVPGISYGTSYNVRVRAKVGGIWGVFGTSCKVTVLQGQFTTKLYKHFCGFTTGNLTSTIYCEYVPGAEDYEYLFVHSASGYSRTVQRGSSLTNISLALVPGISYGKTYDVTVRAKVAGVWGNYGSVCQVTVLDGQFTTKLYNQFCGLTTNNLNANLYCDQVIGAEDYEYLFEHTASGFSQVFRRSTVSGGTLTWIRLNWIPGITTGKTYNVKVKAKVAGVWGNYGTVCTVTVNSTKFEPSESDTLINDMKIFPNPFSDIITIQLETLQSTSYTMEIFDIAGRLILSENGYTNTGLYERTKDFSNYEKGIYLVKVQMGSEVKTLKLIKE